MDYYNLMLHLKDFFEACSNTIFEMFNKTGNKKYKFLLILVSVKHKEGYCWIPAFTKSSLEKKVQAMHTQYWNPMKSNKPSTTNKLSLLGAVATCLLHDRGVTFFIREVYISIQSYVQMYILSCIAGTKLSTLVVIGAVNKKKLYSVICVFFFHFSS